MGWLFGKKDDALYRGDAPASAPGFDGVEPSAYQGTTPSRPYEGSSVGTSPYPASSVPYPTTPSVATPSVATPSFDNPTFDAQPYVPTTPSPPAQFSPTMGGPPSAPAVPQALATAMAYAQSQQRGIKRSLTRTLIGFLVPLLFLGGLVVAGFLVYNNFEDEISDVVNADVFNSDNESDSGPGEPVDGAVGTLVNVTLGDNAYDITIASATSQTTAAPGSIFAPSSGGYLVIQLSLTRTDTNESVSQISWYDWIFTTDGAEPLESDLIAGGYEPRLSTLNLAPNETATGVIVFDTTETVGTLGLTTFDGTWAEWPITALVP